MMRLSLVSLCLFSLVACGGDDGGDTTLVDAGPGSGNADAPPAANCKAAASYTATIDDENGGAGAGKGGIGSFGVLNMDPDVLFVELYDGFGVFENGIAPGTYTLTGGETSFETCGACVILDADAVVDQNGDIIDSEAYMPTGGTLAVTSISGMLEWSLTNVTMQHVTIADDNVTTPVGDGCTTTLTDVTFSAMIDAAQLRSKNAPIRLRAQRVSKH